MWHISLQYVTTPHDDSRDAIQHRAIVSMPEGTHWQDREARTAHRVAFETACQILGSDWPIACIMRNQDDTIIHEHVTQVEREVRERDAED